MITVSEARTRLGRIYDRKCSAWAVVPFMPGDAVLLGLQPPTDRQAASDLGLVASWLSGWSKINVAGLEIIWEQRHWPNSGTQLIPVKLEAQSPQALASFLGRASAWEIHHARAQRLLNLGSGNPPEASAFAAVVSKLMNKIAALENDDFDRVFDVLHWLQQHPGSKLYPRQLPVEGIDSKWLERHLSVIKALHVALGGAEDLGLASAPKHYRVRFLDPVLAPAGLCDVTAPIEQLAKLGVPAHTVIVIENLQTLLSLPEIPGTVALHGAGYDVRWCAQLPWVRAATLLYWGDLDADGLNILAALRSVIPEVRSLMMDVETFTRFAQFAVPDPNGPGRSAPTALTTGETAAYETLRDSGGLRLEQERIDWAHALQVLHQTLDEYPA
ncbi:Wadjet anti-phage system protein JetD domain-containing protein [Glutamicibacter sp. NPDC087344]|uniref:Wadjet anti-phage system protein JetD domain-containing protein n=1 Tax=Glutamicibacter sp. NPDC087344 TaxID=3363994 RepID=UPI00382431F2